MGLDRILEVKTLRKKIGVLCAEQGRAQRWSGTLVQERMAGHPESAGTIYVDGHVRVYHGGLAKLLRRYVARQRLCLRGTIDYWVNAMDGEPFFVRHTMEGTPECRSSAGAHALVLLLECKSGYAQL